MSKKEKLLVRLLALNTSFTWDEAVTVMRHYGFELVKNSGARRVFKHVSGIKAFIHEPHPENTLKEYAMKALIDALKDAGEIE